MQVRSSTAIILRRAAEVSSGTALVALLAVSSACQRSAQTSPLPPGAPPILRAVASGDLLALDRLTAKAKGKAVRQRGPHGWTALHVAAIFGREVAASRLLERGAPASPVDQVGMTPLHWAARKGHASLVALLIARRADPMARNKLDMTPLHEARTRKVAELLIKAGSSLQARDIDGMTPLHIAASREVAQYLIEQGARVDAKSRDGRTPLTMPPTVRPRLE